MDYTLILGLIGTAFILVAFILDEFYKVFNQNTVRYNLFNIIGSLLLVYYSLVFRAWPFVVLNGVWLIVAMIKLIKILKKKK